MFLIDKVRTATQSLHQELDSALIPSIEIIQSKEDYAALLLLFYGFFKPVYDSIDACIDTALLPDFKGRRKPELLVQDLNELEVEYDIRFCGKLPYINNNASAFGALYVLEGSTLGGMVIKKMIADRLGTTSGSSFFSGYGKQTRERWNVFIESLNKLENTDSWIDEAIIQTAATTFAYFKEWVQHEDMLVR